MYRSIRILDSISKDSFPFAAISKKFMIYFHKSKILSLSIALRMMIKCISFCFFEWSWQYHRYFNFRQKSYAWMMIMIMYSKTYLSLNLWEKIWCINFQYIICSLFPPFRRYNVSRCNKVECNITIYWMGEMQICILVWTAFNIH